MKNGLSWENSFAIGDANTKMVPLNALFSRLTRKASRLLPSRQTVIFKNLLLRRDLTFPVRRGIKLSNSVSD